MAAVVVVHAQPAEAQPVRSAAASAARGDDPSIVWEFGWAGDWSAQEGLHNGGTVAFEVEPLEGRLEVEVGFTAIRADEGAELPVDVLFKKPWRFSPRFEFMIGAGPELIHATGRDHHMFWSLATVLNFMFWAKKNVGWYVEPGDEATFKDGVTHHGLAAAAGLLIGHTPRNRTSPRVQ